MQGHLKLRMDAMMHLNYKIFQTCFCNITHTYFIYTHGRDTINGNKSFAAKNKYFHFYLDGLSLQNIIAFSQFKCITIIITFIHI